MWAERLWNVIKSIRNGFDTVCDLQSLLEAHFKARRGKGSKAEVLRFETHLVSNLEYIRQALASHTYTISHYRHFKVYEPKEREIMALSYPDRIVQHSLCDNVLEPFLDKILDYDNAACRKGKGTHFALDRLKFFMKKAYDKWGCDYYVLKCDIHKYFYCINHDILKKNLYKRIEDKDIVWLLDVIIDSTNGNVGIPIGNMTSQWFAIYYLDTMDRFIRNELKIPFYSRYMDDFILIDKDKENLKKCLNMLTKFLNDELELKLNQKTQIFPIKNGVDYLGFHSYLTETGKVVRKIRKKSKEKMKRKVKYFNKAYQTGKITNEKVKMCVASWTGHAKHGDTYNLRKEIMKKIILKGGNQTDEEETFFNDSRDYDI